MAAGAPPGPIGATCFKAPLSTKYYASLATDDRVLLLYGWKWSHTLCLYELGVDLRQLFVSFAESGLESGEVCVFAYDCRTSRLHPEAVFGKWIAARSLHLFPMGEKNPAHEIKSIYARLEDLGPRIPSEYRALRTVIDFGNSYSIDGTIDFIKRLHNAPFPVKSMTAFEISSLSSNAIESLMQLHEDVVVSTKSQHLMMPNFRSVHAPNSLTIETIPRSAFERFVKKHLETVVLSILLQDPLCGYDVIRRIYRQYHVFLSQGTVYPLLYNLEREGLLTLVKSEGNPRSKVYALTRHGKEEARTRIDNFLLAEKYMLESLSKT